MDDISPPPDVTEEPYHCAGRCGAVVGMLVRVAGQPVGLHVQTVTGGWMLAVNLRAVCARCGAVTHYHLTDTQIGQAAAALADAKAAGLW